MSNGQSNCLHGCTDKADFSINFNLIMMDTPTYGGDSRQYFYKISVKRVMLCSIQ